MKCFFLLPPSVTGQPGVEKVGVEVHWVNQYGGKICQLEISETAIEELAGIFVQIVPAHTNPVDLDELVYDSGFIIPGSADRAKSP